MLVELLDLILSRFRGLQALGEGCLHCNHAFDHNEAGKQTTRNLMLGHRAKRAFQPANELELCDSSPISATHISQLSLEI